jgi:ParB-like chromosome segregation protein Spo0J
VGIKFYIQNIKQSKNQNMSAIFRSVPHSLIAPKEGFNVRKRFNAEKGVELRASIREHGIRNALEVVQMPGEGEQYELVAGERRWRENGGLLEDLKREAEQAASAEEIERLQQLWKDRFEVPVRVLTEAEVPQARMLNLIENLLRDDISAAEEADGYHQALQEVNPDTGAVYTIAELAGKLGRDAQHVRRRLKLRQAPRLLLDAIDEGKVAATVAELVGRIPDPKAREEVAALILKPVDPAPEQEVPLNFVQAKQLIREHFMISLKSCGFDVNDPDLLPVKHDEAGVRLCGGSCADCPMRSGNNDELKEELAATKKGKGGGAGIDPMLCTNPSCFRAKQDEVWKVTKRLAEQKGDKVVDGDASRKLFGGWQGDLSYDAKYSRGTDKVYQAAPYGAPAYEMTLSQLSQGLKVPAVVAKNPHTGKIEHLVDKKAILEAAKKQRPELFKVAKGSGGGSSSSNDEDKKRKERCKRYEAVNRACATALFEKMSAKGIGLEEQMVVFEEVLRSGSEEDSRMMGQWLEIKLEKKDREGSLGSGRAYNKKILAHVKEHGTTLPALQAFTFIMMIAGHLRASMWSEGNDRGDAFDALAKAYGVDCKAITKRVTEALAQELKGKASGKKKRGDAEKGRRGEGAGASVSGERSDGEEDLTDGGFFDKCAGCGEVMNVKKGASDPEKGKTKCGNCEPGSPYVLRKDIPGPKATKKAAAKKVAKKASKKVAKKKGK